MSNDSIYMAFDVLNAGENQHRIARVDFTEAQERLAILDADNPDRRLLAKVRFIKAQARLERATKIRDAMKQTITDAGLAMSRADCIHWEARAELDELVKVFGEGVRKPATPSHMSEEAI